MAITVKNISELFGKDVFSNRGVYAGKVADIEVNLGKFRVRSLVVDAGRGSFLSGLTGGKGRGVIVPYQLVENVGDVVIIKHVATPNMPEMPESAEAEPAMITQF